MIEVVELSEGRSSRGIRSRDRRCSGGRTVGSGRWRYFLNIFLYDFFDNWCGRSNGGVLVVVAGVARYGSRSPNSFSELSRCRCV